MTLKRQNQQIPALLQKYASGRKRDFGGERQVVEMGDLAPECAGEARGPRWWREWVQSLSPQEGALPSQMQSEGLGLRKLDTRVKSADSHDTHRLSGSRPALPRECGRP